MTEPTEPRPRAERSDALRIALAIFVALGAAAGLFALGVQYAHHDRDHMGGGSMMGGGSGDGQMMGGGGMMGGGSMMGGGMGMMGSMNVESERDFLQQMIPHHEEAIESAKVLKAGTDRDEMRDFADDIIETQQAELDRMTGWLEQWHDGAKPSADYRPMMRSDLAELEGDDLDQAFLQDMTMHHMMAVHMSQSLVGQDLARHDEVEELAASIAATQMREIQQMRTWHAEWFGSADRRGGDTRPRAGQ